MPRKELGAPDENRRKATRLFDEGKPESKANNGLRVQVSTCKQKNATDESGALKFSARDSNDGLRVRCKDKKEKPSATAYAVKLLAFKTYTERGLREKLKGKEYSSAEIDKAIEYTKKQGYVNDRLIAQNALEKLSVKYGKRRIFAYLASKGIPREVLEGLDASEIDFKENARILACKMAAKGKEHEKIAASLVRAGFSSSEIYYALAEIE